MLITAKLLSMATIPLCFASGVVQCSTISIAVFCLQNLVFLLVIFADEVFIDPTFFGIFVCGPFQSFVVNVRRNVKADFTKGPSGSK